jgi:hypothetical protein
MLVLNKIHFYIASNKASRLKHAIISNQSKKCMIMKKKNWNNNDNTLYQIYID